MGFRVETKGFDELDRKLEMAKRRVENAVGATVRTYADIIMEDARRNAPVDEGTLRASFGTLKKGLEAAAYNDADHARPVEFGADRHDIPPNTADRLIFFWERENRMFIGREGQAVDHPGMDGEHYFEEAIHKQWPRLKRDLRKNVKRALGF
jgi:HK97 gp10 family phage protein